MTLNIVSVLLRKFELTNQLLNYYLLFNDDTIFQLIILSHDKT